MTTVIIFLHRNMAATSLKLPEDLKRRIERLAGAANKTPHAFMIDALSQEVDRSELRERFASDSTVAENETMTSGKAIPLDAAFHYFEARISGKKIRRPRARAWRASK
jgi:predicted transcriptional regulator